MADVTDPAPIPDVAVAGLRVPADLAIRIITALRAVYPSVAADRDDEGVVRAVLLHWITTTLAQYEGSKIEALTEAALETVRADQAAKAALARQQAVADAQRIREAPSGAAEPNLPGTAPEGS